MANTLQRHGWISGIRTQAASVAWALAVVMMLAAAASPSAQAQTFDLLYSFKGQTQKDGDGPFAVLTRDAAGNLYGTTQGGGVGFGTVFKLDTLGQETVLYSFNGTGGDGQSPSGSLARDAAGNLYGTTGGGGASGFGTVFKLDTTGTETVLHSFVGGQRTGKIQVGV